MNSDKVNSFDDDVVDASDDLSTLVDDNENLGELEPSEHKSVTYGVSINSGDLLFKIDNKTIKKVPLKSLRGLDASSVKAIGDLIAEFRAYGVDQAIKKFKN